MIEALYAAVLRLVRLIFESLRRAAKLTIVVGVIVVSTALFYVWWRTRSPKAVGIQRIDDQRQEENIQERVAKAEAAMGRLVMVNDDLFDVETGELLFSNWLKYGFPQKLFWEADSKTVLAQYGAAFVRYGLDGTEKASINRPFKFAVAPDYKWIVDSRQADIWKAEVDWKALKLINERKVTSIAQFSDFNFSGDVVFGSENTLFVLHQLRLLRVALATGEVHQAKIPMPEIAKRRSPDGKWVVGVQGGQFYCYDADADDSKSLPIGKGAVNDFQWLGNDRCAVIQALKTVILYDRPNNKLTEICSLPFPCNGIGNPSPDGRYVFCKSSRPGEPHLLLDVESRTTTPIVGGRAISWVSNDTFTFSREVPDSTYRGTWMQSVGGEERRVAPEPYLVSNRGESVIRLKSSGLLVFGIKQGVMKMKPDGGEAAQTIKVPQPFFQLVQVENWPFSQRNYGIQP